MPQQFASPTLSPFTAADGENLALHEWPVAADTPLRGLVVLVHGLGEHAGRYGAVAEQLNTWGFAVRGYDHYGHGESAGPRGGLSSDTRLLDDLADMIECTRARLPPGLPLVLLGHSMGGQLGVWTLLEEEGFGASLQHYNPLIDEAVQVQWNLPASWKLIAEMPFGIPVQGPGEKEFKPLDERFKVFK